MPLGSVDAPIITNHQQVETVQPQQFIDVTATSNQHNMQASDIITPAGMQFYFYFILY